MYGFLADLVMVLHFAFIILVIFGGFLALRWQRFAAICPGALAGGVVGSFFGAQARYLLPIDPLGAITESAGW